LKDYITKYRTQSISYVEWQNHYITEVKTKYGDQADKILSQIDWDAWIKAPGFLPHENDFTNKWSQQASDSRDALFAGTLTKDFATVFKNWFTDVKLDFFYLVIEKIADFKETHYVFLRDTLTLNTGYNMEVENMWYQLSLMTKHTDAYSYITDFLGKIGRMKYIRPIYHFWALLDKTKAYSVFLANK
jgi:leukotriene-A4 hydrolase